MKYTCLTPDEARQQCSRYKYALVYEISRMQFGRTEQIDPVNWDEVADARFCDSTGELHYYNDGTGPQAYKLEDENETDESCHEYVCSMVSNKDGYSKMVVKEYYQYDEDGQLHVVMTRLAGMA